MRKSKIWDIAGAVGILLGILVSSYSWLTTFGDVPPLIKDWRWGIGFGMFIFFISATFLVYKLYGISTWAEPNIVINHLKKDIYKDGEFGWDVLLEIRNSEQTEIKNCYATLEIANDIYWRDSWLRLPLIPSMSRKPERIIWVESEDSNETCEIEIPPTSSRHVNLADTIGDFRYNLRSGKLSPNWMIGSKIHEVQVRIDGKIKEKSMKPLFFKGYIYYNLKVFHFSARETQNGRFMQNIKGSQVTPYVIFGAGDWTKDKQIFNELEIEGEESKKWEEINENKELKTPVKITKKKKPSRKKAS